MAWVLSMILLRTILTYFLHVAVDGETTAPRMICNAVFLHLSSNAGSWETSRRHSPQAKQEAMGAYSMFTDGELTRSISTARSAGIFHLVWFYMLEFCWFLKLSIWLFFFFMATHVWYVEVPRPGVKPLYWQCQLLQLLHHMRTQSKFPKLLFNQCLLNTFYEPGRYCSE